jgi:hypothetical protein
MKAGHTLDTAQVSEPHDFKQVITYCTQAQAYVKLWQVQSFQCASKTWQLNCSGTSLKLLGNVLYNPSHEDKAHIVV